jgi:hypothetical protein
MPAAKKSKKAVPEKTLESSPAVTRLVIPCRYEYAVSPLEMATDYSAKEIKAKACDTVLKAAVVGDFVGVQNSDCDDLFIIHKDVLRELADKAGA